MFGELIISAPDWEKKHGFDLSAGSAVGEFVSAYRRGIIGTASAFRSPRNWPLPLSAMGVAAFSAEPVVLALPLSEIGDRVGGPVELSEQDVERLVVSLSVHPQFHPIGVDEQYRPVFGFARLEACRRLGRDTINVTIFPGLSDSVGDREVLRAAENIDRSKTTLEQDLAVVREIRPHLAARDEAHRRANGANRAAIRWGDRVAGEQITPATNEPVQADEKSEVIAGEQITPTMAAILKRPGKSRTIIGAVTTRSWKTMERFEELAALSEDESLPEPVRAEVLKLRTAANITNKVDPNLKRALQLVGTLTGPVEPAPAELHNKLMTEFIGTVTLNEEKVARLCEGDIVTAIRHDPLARQNWTHILRSMKRTQALLDAVDERLGR